MKVALLLKHNFLGGFDSMLQKNESRNSTRFPPGA